MRPIASRSVVQQNSTASASSISDFSTSEASSGSAGGLARPAATATLYMVVKSFGASLTEPPAAAACARPARCPCRFWRTSARPGRLWSAVSSASASSAKTARKAAFTF